MLWWTMKKLRSTSLDTRNQAIEELVALGPRAVDPLVQAITSEGAAVTEAAQVALVRIGEPAVTPLLKALKTSHASGDIGLRMIQCMGLSRVLASIGGPAIPHLLIALKDNDKYVRWAAVGALGLVRDPHLLEPLLELLNDTDPMVRLSTAIAVGWAKDPRTIDALTSALQDEDEDVRKAAAEALREMGADAK